MREFLLIFRGDYKSMPKGSPEEMQEVTQKWMDWIAGIAAQNKLTDRGNRLESSGRVVKGNHTVSDGPYAEIKESIMGYTLVHATSIEEATTLVQGCPIFYFGGNVEIREISAL